MPQINHPTKSYLKYEVRGGNTIEIVDIFASVRRRGIGTALVLKLIDREKNSVPQLLYAITRASNGPAIAFYTALGMRHTGTLDQFYPGKNGAGDALVFSKMI